MAIPVSPDDFKAVIPAANAKLCTKLLAVFIRLPKLIYDVFKWGVNDDLTATDDLKAWLGVSGSGGLDAPSDIVASDGTYTDKVALTWSAVTGATKYDIYRTTVNTAPASGVAPIAVDQTGTTYEDTSAVLNTSYWYWLKAKTDSGVSSGFSTSDLGYAGAASGESSGQIPIPDSVQSWTYTGADTLAAEIHVWAGGGGGGGINLGNNPGGVGFPTPNKFGGGGGGSGAYKKVTGLALNNGDILQITIGSGGSGNQTRSQPTGSSSQSWSGGNGSATVVSVNGVEKVKAYGGAGGSSGGDLNSAPGGAGGVGGTGTTGTDGNAGSSGSQSPTPYTGGAGGAAVSQTIGGTAYSAGAGGKGLGDESAAVAGGRGLVVIKW